MYHTTLWTRGYMYCMYIERNEFDIKHRSCFFVHSRLFWSDYRSDGSRIETSDLLGGNRKAIVIHGNIVPDSLVADVITKRLYWVDR